MLLLLLFTQVVFNPSILASRKVLIFINNFGDSSEYTHPNPNKFITSVEEIPEYKEYKIPILYLTCGNGNGNVLDYGNYPPVVEAIKAQDGV